VLPLLLVVVVVGALVVAVAPPLLPSVVDLLVVVFGIALFDSFGGALVVVVFDDGMGLACTWMVVLALDVVAGDDTDTDDDGGTLVVPFGVFP